MTTEPTTDKQTNNWPTILFKTEYFPFERKKQVLARFEPRTFDTPGIRVISRLSWQETLRSFNILYGKLPLEMNPDVQMSPVNKLFTEQTY